MKRILALILTAALTTALCACSREVEVVAQETPALDPLVTAAPEPTPAEPAAQVEPEVDAAAQTEALNALLTDITESVRPGSSGCSLRAARCTAALLDWCAACSISDEAIVEAVDQWVAAQTADSQALFTESMSFIAETLPQLQGENAKDLLDSAGVLESGYPWSDIVYQTAQTVCAAGQA